jgi:hypothetical protein
MPRPFANSQWAGVAPRRRRSCVTREMSEYEREENKSAMDSVALVLAASRRLADRRSGSGRESDL